MSELLTYEREITCDYSVYCGVDEAGRGPLAGPVYAAAVIMPKNFVIEKINDSKKLTEKMRDKLYDEIIEAAESYAIASASVDEIEELNILNASQLAMRRAVDLLKVKPQIALIDGNVARDFNIDTKCVIGGDAKCQSIAAASILAKVARDRYMYELDKQYPQYGFAKHKGYGTKAHYDAIREYGLCNQHRPSFLRKFLNG